MGFWDLYLFNKAMLARREWRLLQNPESLCAQVLRAKYYPNDIILNCLPRHGISYSWRSILTGLELLKKGIIWRVGDGTSISIWSDPWLPKGDTRRPATPRRASLLTTVSELINPITGGWDEQLVKDIFWEEDAEVNLSIPIGEGMQDWLAWHYDSAGRFSVKSTYKLAIQNRGGDEGRDATTSASSAMQGSEFEWHKIWQLRVPNKVNMFVRRFTHSSLPVRRNLKRRGVKIETICPV